MARVESVVSDFDKLNRDKEKGIEDQDNRGNDLER